MNSALTLTQFASPTYDFKKSNKLIVKYPFEFHTTPVKDLWNISYRGSVNSE